MAEETKDVRKAQPAKKPRATKKVPYTPITLSSWLATYPLPIAAFAAWGAATRLPDASWPAWVLLGGVTVTLAAVGDSALWLLFSIAAVVAWGFATGWHTLPTVDPALCLVFAIVGLSSVVWGILASGARRCAFSPGTVVRRDGFFAQRETITFQNVSLRVHPRSFRQLLLGCADITVDLGGRVLRVADVFRAQVAEDRIRAASS